MMIGLGLDGYDPDSQHDAAVAFRIRVVAEEQYTPASSPQGTADSGAGGAITCEVENAMLMVPPQYAVWIPGQMPHSNRATPGAQLCFLFIEPGAASLPDRCCTLKMSPLVRELILSLAEKSQHSFSLRPHPDWSMSCLMNCRSSVRSIYSCPSRPIQKSG
jgi:hypothetical protein